MRFIVDIGSNHTIAGGSPSKDRAVELVRQAAKSGATDVKFQMFDKLHRNDSTQKQISKLSLPKSWIPELSDICEDYGVKFLCTPFSLDAVEFLDPYVDEYKIASWDITFKPMIEAIAETNKDVIMSTGGATIREIREAVKWLYGEKMLNSPSYRRDSLTLLHCTGGYPTPPAKMQLNKILEIGAALNLKVPRLGVSSHCIDPYVVASSVLYSCDVFEVHFDLGDKNGTESGHSYTPQTLPILIKYAKLLKQGMVYDGLDDLDKFARENYRRDSSDWLRPVIK